MKTKNAKRLLGIALCFFMLFGCAFLHTVAAEEATISDYESATLVTSENYESLGLSSDYIDYYAINNAGNLYWFAEFVNAGNTSANAILTANIVVNKGVLVEGALASDVSGFRVWTPIGNSYNCYFGTFEGNGKTISGLYFNNTATDYVGLFGYAGGGSTIQNVGVIDSYFAGNDYVGGVVGYNNGTVTNCYNTGIVSGNMYVGGVVGDNYGTVTNCYNTGIVSGNENYVGGVVGYNYSDTVTNCYNTGIVSGYNHVGGVVGYNSGTVTNCYNTEGVSGNNYVGGVVGSNSGTVTNCYNTEGVSGNNYVGGVVGYNRGTATNCYNTGIVSGNRYVGGVVGYNYYGTATNCYNTGNVSGNDNYVGGVVGYNYNNSAVTNCYNTGNVSGNSGVGGVAGYNYTSGTVTNCYYLKTEEANTNLGGINGADAEGQAEAKTEEQFASGEVTYLLNSGITDGTQAYYQTAGVGLPAFEGDTVYYSQTGGCTEETYVYGYSNTAEAIITHSNSNGICEHCGKYEPATLVTSENCESLGLSSDYIDYYAINNAGNLYWFAEFVNAGNTSEKAILTDNIVVNQGVLVEGELASDTSSFRAWTPIGSDSNVYIGTFEGNGKTISGLYFNDAATSYVGLFGYTGDGGTIQNVGVIDSYFAGKLYVGGVVGFNDCTVTNCYNNGNVSGRYDVGGVVGFNDCTVTNCYNTGVVSGNNDIGGVVGGNNGTVTNCYNTGIVSGNENYVGGVVGYNSGTVTNCYNAEGVSGNYYVGGVVGGNNGTVTNCYNTGDVSGNDGVGGVAGENYYGEVTNCYNTGNVSGNNYVGGVVGYNDNGTVTNCYNAGIVSGRYDVGGVVGYNDSTVTNCYYLKTEETNINLGGINGTDVTSQAEAKTEAQFASGEVTYLLNGGITDGTQAYYQTVGTGLPAFEGDTVYYGQTGGCTEETYVYGYSNTAEAIITHSNSNGICEHCGKYEPASLVTSENCESLGLTSDYIDYYAINNAGNLYWFAEFVNAGNTDVKAILTDNIVVNEGVLVEGELASDVSGFKVWTPIGSDSNKYIGTFEGNGKTISGLYFNDTNTDNVGLFSYTGDGGIIQNVGVIDSYFAGNDYVGGVVGRNYYGTVTNCYNTGDFSGDYYVGGVVGANDGTVTNCHNTGNVSGNENYVGGVAGDNNGTVTNCYNEGDVSGEYSVGGVVGRNYNGTVTNCYNTEGVSGDYNVGGVVGYNSGGTVTNCYNAGNVSGESSYVGGVVGYIFNGTVTNCYNTDIVSGNNYVGGVVGLNNNSTVTNCYYLKTDKINTNVGGIGGEDVEGQAEAKTEAQFASGEVTYLLNGGITDGTQAYYQTVGTGLPAFEGDTVYGNQTGGCTEETYTYEYSNTAKEAVITHGNYNADGFCGYCGNGYEPATLVTSENYESMGLSSDYIDYYAINNAGNLYWFAEFVNAGNTSAKAILTENIVVNQGVLVEGELASDTSGFKVWTPIGNSSNVYIGTFEGNGKTISGLYFNDTATNYVGLFGYTGDGGIIQNVGVIDSYFAGNDYVGGVVGYNTGGTVTNCYNTSDVSGDYYVGGMVGRNYSGTVTNCYNTEGVSGNDYVGGVAGYNRGTVTNCYNTGNVSGDRYVGGVVGRNYNGTVTNCYNTEGVSGNYNVGGVVGYNDVGTVTNCYNTGDVSGNYNVGGVVGYNSKGTVTNCYNTEGVSGESSYVGGVVGYNYYGTVTNCHNTGDVSGKNYVGGVVGRTYYGTVTNCYNTGDVSGNSDVGSVVGLNSDGTVTNCYYLKTEEINTNVGGINGTDVAGQAEAKTEAQFASGEVAYLLNGGKTDGTQAYYQTVGTGLPAFEGDTVYYGQTGGCTEETYVNGYSNTAEAIITHSNSNGICEHCGKYEPATLVTSENCESLGLSSDYIDYYAINNAGNLYWFAEFVNTGNTGAKAILTDNIVVNEGVLVEGELASDVSGFKVWTPIGNSSNVYIGTFEGNGKTISGLYFNDTATNYVGLFSYTEDGGIIQNVGVIDSYFAGKWYVGGVVGYNYYGTVTNCYNAGNVSGNDTVGGVVGDNYNGTVANCYNTGVVSGTDDYVGGVVGLNGEGTVTNCYNAGDVSGNYNVGGVVGYNRGAVTNCYNTEDVSGDTNVGGVIGYNRYTVTNCYNAGNVSGDYYVGGVVGYNDGTLTNCYNENVISGNDSVGGVVGYNYTSSTVTNCYNTEGVSGDTNVGGVVGDNRGAVTNCYNTNIVSGNYNVGGVVGDNFNGTVANCYNTGNVSGDTDVGGAVGNNNGTVTNCYYLAGCSDVGIGNQSSDGESAVTAVTAEQVKAACGVEGALVDMLNNWVAEQNDPQYIGWHFCSDVSSEHPTLNIACTYTNKGENHIANCDLCEHEATEEHAYIYTANEDKIDISCGHCTYTASIYLVLPEAPVYNGNAQEASYAGDFTNTNGNIQIQYMGYNEETDTFDKVLDSAPVDAGTYIVRLVAGEAYIEKTLTIAPATITIIGAEVNYKYYDGTPYVEINNNYGGFEFEGLLNYDSIEIICTSAEVGSANAGSYSQVTVKGLTITGEDAHNYIVVSEATVPVYNIWGNYETTVTVYQKYLTIIIADQEAGSIDAIDQSKWEIDEYDKLLEGHSIESLNLVAEMNEGSVKYGSISLEDGSVKIVDADGNDVTGNYSISAYSAKLTVTCPDHDEFENGFCTNCGGFEKPAYNENEGFYEIANAGQLFWLADYINNVSNEVNAKLVADITIPADKEWTPIYNLYGTFDGNFKTISGLKVSDTESDYVGFLGYIGYWADVRNLHITNSSFTDEDASSLGAIAGYHGGGEIVNCYVDNTTITGNGSIGALVGNGYGTIRNCYATSVLVGWGYYATFENCFYIGEDDGFDGTTAVTEEQFASGEIAYLLQSAQTGEPLYDEESGDYLYDENGDVIYSEAPHVWGQTIGTDTYPVFGGDMVYSVLNCKDETAYSNTNKDIRHTIVDGICTLCGHVENEVAFSGASLTLEDDLVINYKVVAALMEEDGYTNPYVKFVFNGKEIIVDEYRVEGDKYVFDFVDIIPHQMNDVIYATLYVTRDGTLYSSETNEYSVATYCYNMLSKYNTDEYAEFRTLLVDLLNYGEASQNYMDYKTDNLVTANLTDEQKVWGTAEDPTLETVQNLEYATVENPTVTWKSGGLNLSDNFWLRFKIGADNIEGLTVKATLNTQEWTIDSSEFVETTGGYYVYVKGINASQMSDTVYLTVYNGDTAVSNTISYSVESYAYSKQNDSDAKLVAIVKAMMKYGNSAKALIS